ncbi:unknown [Clostridium sp. CAG:967]|nr:unknown [Clostridium sp. CAG:967]
MKTNNVNNISFTNAGNIGTCLKAASKIVAVQEGGAGLSNIRFIQDTATGLAPKAVFARSKADLVENSFLELSESMLVYYCPAILGEGIFRKLYSNKLPQNLKKQISTPATELLKQNKALDNKKLLPVKAALALSALAIPLVEYSLNYIKNLMTLKMFKQGNFDNIANLDKEKKINNELNNKVEKSAKKHIKHTAGIYAGCLALSTLLVKKGQNSKVLQNLSEAILAPGTKFFKNNKNKADFFNKYFSLDFADNNGKLALSKGQLTSCVLVGGAGYFGASKDRGKQNFLETLFRFPLVGFYIICGNELLEKGFKKLLYKNGKCKELINEKLEVPQLKDLRKIAEKHSGNVDAMYKKLLKQKVLIAGVPLLFGIGVMGFFIAGTSNLFTKYRYNKEHNQETTKSLK